ncbi:MAG TPA: Uma2 family endonuclease [Blastocatellia bacterium]|nr:Uma2 family endonuclease [Blastocatellia bacterium]
MATATQQRTAEELLLMPDDGFRYELVKGELKKMAPASHEHGRVTMNISTPLDSHVRTNDLGIVFAAETGFKLASNPDTVRAPDVAFVSRSRIDQVGDAKGYWPGAPDLAVEVVSPGDTYTDVEEKVLEWLQAGVRAAIVANPRKRVATVYRSLTDIIVLTEDDTLEIPDIVPGWRISVRSIFE